MGEIRIVLAEDHTLVREGTRNLLEQAPDLRVVGEAGDGERALELIQELAPEVAILDIRMPRLGGIDVVRRMRERSPGTSALMLTAYDDDDYIMALMDEGGVSGYLLKTAPANELVDAVRTVARGQPVVHPAIAAKMARLWSGGGKAEEGRARELSPRERQVVELVARGLRNKEIADQLGISVRTSENHLNAALVKLGLSSRIEAALFAVGQGWVSPQHSTQR